VHSVLTAAGSEASTTAGAEALAQADVSGATPIMAGLDQLQTGRAQVPAGTVYAAVPFNRGWQLTLDGTEVVGRPAFGSTLAFDVQAPGTVALSYVTPSSVRLMLLAQALGWIVVCLAASHFRFRRPRERWRGSDDVIGPVFTLDPFIALPGAAGVPSDDRTTDLTRPAFDDDDAESALDVMAAAHPDAEGDDLSIRGESVGDESVTEDEPSSDEVQA
jgi:hypothetical protein